MWIGKSNLSLAIVVDVGAAVVTEAAAEVLKRTRGDQSSR